MNSQQPQAAKKSNNKKKRGVDALLTALGKDLKPGGTVTVRLIKGPNTTTTADPVDPKAPLESFPLLGKFPESVVRPDFTTTPWCKARLYQQDVPKPADDSDDYDDDEDDDAAGGQQAQQKKKKRWKYNRKRDQVAARQWILQEQVDFLETMVAQREKRDLHLKKLSTRYEGIPEANQSHYVLLRLPAHAVIPTTVSSSLSNMNEHDDEPIHSLTVQPIPHPNSTVTFAQPASRKTYSLTEAEQAITDQRMGLARRTMHSRHDADQKQKTAAAASASAAADAAAATNTGGDNHAQPEKTSAAAAAASAPTRRLVLPGKRKNTSKHRLLSKFQKRDAAARGAGDEEEGDDVMGDVTFRSRKGTGGAARRELLQDMVGEHVKVSDEGVLGGSNDAAFGGRQRFAQFAADKKEQSDGNNNAGTDDAGETAAADKERGADGAAMADDFYQRDVQAEYEELDYDANEQFDDDDVDLGEAEVVVDSSGFGADAVDAELEDELDDEDGDGDEESVSGAAGLASAAGFKALLDRAQKEGTTDAAAVAEAEAAAAAAAANAQAGGDKKDDKKAGAGDKKLAKKQSSQHRQVNGHMAKLLNAVEVSREEKRKSATGGAAAADAAAAAADQEAAEAHAQQPQHKDSNNSNNAAAAAASSTELANQVDAQGNRILSLQAVRREIWLENGSIPMKRLMKIFGIGKKTSKERREEFKAMIKELCIMQTDPVNGRGVLVLKQHYSNMG